MNFENLRGYIFIQERATPEKMLLENQMQWWLTRVRAKVSIREVDRWV